MAIGVARSPPVDEADLSRFSETLAALPAEEWQRRIAALRGLVDSIPDYSTTPLDDGTAPNEAMAWYRSSKSVRRLALPLKTLLLDARSAVVKEATELITTLMTVKLQPHPSFTMAEGDDDAGLDEAAQSNDGALETISGGLDATKVQRPPPPAFVGRLLLKDLLPAILDMSKQTVKTIRTYGVNMTIDILPHCRVKSCLVLLLERMKTHQSRTVREDCARYSRCVLETWPCDNGSNEDIGIVNSRKEERLSLDATRQIGLGLGRTLSDSAKPVREEAKRGFQVLFKRFRPIWDEVLNSGVVRDVRLRKKLLDAANRAEGNLFDDAASLGGMSLNSEVSGLSYASQRSYASRGMTSSNGVPSMIGTPKGSPRMRSRGRYSPSSSPTYMRGTGSSSARIVEQGKIQAKEASDKYATNRYVTSSGHVMATPTRKTKNSRSEEEALSVTPQQPFASLLQTPSRSAARLTPERPKSGKDLRKRLSRRISGIKGHIEEDIPMSPSQLTSISETGDDNGTRTAEDNNTAEITNVALEVVAAHLSHFEEIEAQLAKERELLVSLNKQLGITISDGTKTSELAERLATLSEEQVCDYFEGVHMCVSKQQNANETLLQELERISEGDASESGLASPESIQRRDLAQSPLGDPDLASMSRDLRDDFG